MDVISTLGVPNLYIMTYRIKSLIYFSCFAISAFLYYGIEQEDEFQNQVSNKEFAEIEFMDDLESEKLQDEILEPQR